MPTSPPIPVLVVLLTLPVSAAAQAIRGVVVDEEIRASPRDSLVTPGIEGAEIEMTREGGEAGLRTLTDSLGNFYLAAPEAGVFNLRVSHPAYVSYHVERIEVGDGETLTIELRMGRNVIPLDPLVVTARMNSLMAGFHQRRNGGGLGTFLTREEIDTRGAGRATDLLRDMPGVRVEFERWGVGPSIVMQGGFGRCTPAIFVDGIQMTQAGGVGSSLDDYITPERIEGMEVYTSFSTVPVQYHSGMCGVILIWTRQGGREGGEPWGWKRMLLGFAVAVGLVLWIR